LLAGLSPLPLVFSVTTKYGIPDARKAQDMAKVKVKKRRFFAFPPVALLVFALSWFLTSGLFDGPPHLLAEDQVAARNQVLADDFENQTRITPGAGPEVRISAEVGEHRVFVYGTLRFSLVRRLVMGSSGDPEPATLPGFRRRGLNITEEEGAEVRGLLLRVDPAELAALDRYERIGVRYQRRRVTLADGTEAWVYQRL
jgi:gamma-glutamylcyclotransferase (GGCT)/AIG2-like uncharacterized protein YtfP